MGKLDEVKEILNTLRLLFSIGVGLVVVVTGSLIAKEQSGSIDLYFWLGVCLVVGLLGLIAYLARSIRKIQKRSGTYDGTVGDCLACIGVCRCFDLCTARVHIHKDPALKKGG